MNTHGRTRRVPAGFTLVELLTVIVIISILVGLLTGALIVARNAANRAVIKMDLELFADKLEAYRTKFGEYPPSFANINHPVQALRDAARADVLRHLRLRFPRYTPVGNNPGDPPWQRFVDDLINNYNVDPNGFDASMGLVFWLGGLPETVPAAAGSPWTPAGFHADVNFPFRPGLPRTDRLMEFDQGRLGHWAQGDTFQYVPARVTPRTPYVYFRGRRDQTSNKYEYGVVESGKFYPFLYPPTASGTTDVAVAYLDESSATSGLDGPLADPTQPQRRWRDEEKFQIISAGLDGEFGLRNASDIAGASNLDTEMPFSQLGRNFKDGDFNNLTSFAKNQLEDEL